MTTTEDSNANTAVIQVEPDSNGNVTLTIKLVIATGGTRVPPSVDAAPAPETNERETACSENLSTSYEDSEGNDEFSESSGVATKGQQYSLRSKVRVQDDSDNNDDGDDYEVDWQLSQQVPRFNVSSM